MKFVILFESGNYGVHYVKKCSDEMVVEICESYECLDVSNTHRGLSILNSFIFLRVYVDAFDKNDQS